MKTFFRYSFYAADMVLNNFYSIMTTLCMRIKLFCLVVPIGRGSKFYGKTYLELHPTSDIVLGKNCIFRSAFYSNSIGLKQKCFISCAREAKINIGDNCGFSGTVIAAETEILIGDRVFCGANVTIADADRHPIDARLRGQNAKGASKKISIGSDVWIGMNSVVLKGVEIGDNVVIGANSIVTSNIPANSLAVGCPAKVIRRIN